MSLNISSVDVFRSFLSNILGMSREISLGLTWGLNVGALAGMSSEMQGIGNAFVREGIFGNDFEHVFRKVCCVDRFQMF